MFYGRSAVGCGILVGLLGLTSDTSPRLLASHDTPVGQFESGTATVATYGHVPLSFQPNRGQFRSQFPFGSEGVGYALFIDSTRASLTLRGSASNQMSNQIRLDLRFVGANTHAIVRGAEPLAGVANYFQGSRDQWITNVPTYQRVTVDNVYPGVDLTYYGNQSQLEYDFVVRPRISPDVIDLNFSSASSVSIADDGALAITIGEATIHQSRPETYQIVRGVRLPVRSGYVIKHGRHVGFDVGPYDPRLPLVIDPQLVYSIYGPAMTRAYGIGVDSQGNAYIAGTTFDPLREGNTNAYTFKLNAAGTAVLWQASFGSGNYNDSATAIAVDASGSAYVTGWTEYPNAVPAFPHFPTVNALQANPSGPSDAFVTTFDTNGNMTYSTLIGGAGADRADGIGLNGSGNIVITGKTTSADFPTAQALQPALRGTSDAFVAALNPDGSALLYSTYVGGSGDDAGVGVAVDVNGNAYVTGSTTSTDFPTPNAIRFANAGGLDAFIFELDATGSSLLYGTYLGGSSDDSPTGIAVDGLNAAYVTGRTNSPDFPTASAFQNTLQGGFDAFVTKVDATGSAFGYSTYLGGAADETSASSWCAEKPTCGGIAVNSAGNAYVTGVTASADFPQVHSGQAFAGTTDAFVAEMATNGSSLIYSALLGGAVNQQQATSQSGSNSGSAIAYLDGNAYVTGLTDASDFPITGNPTNGPCCVNNAWNGVDGFVAKLADDAASTTGWTRVEQDDSAVRYTGDWYTNSNQRESGGNARLAQSGSATFSFSGTGVRWVGFSDPWSGIANVRVDGVLQSPVDTYAGADEYQAVHYAITDLAPGSHTLIIEATGQANVEASSSWIWVDAFEYLSDGGGGTGGDGGDGGDDGGGTPPSDWTRLEQNDSSIEYSGEWYLNSNPSESGGNALLALSGSATFSFSGTGARWIGFSDPWSGIASVYVDGALQAAVDTYSAESKYQAVQYTITGLAPGNHTLEIETTGQSNAAASAPWIWIDAVEFMSGAGGGGGGEPPTVTWTRIEQNSSSVTYSGEWHVNSNPNESGGNASLALGGSASLQFSGTGVRWIGFSDQWAGIANVYVDGELKGSVDTYADSGAYQTVQYAITGLTAGPHTLTIEATGEQDSAAQAPWIWIDAFEYTN
jgi:hypothetical protein